VFDPSRDPPDHARILMPGSVVRLSAGRTQMSDEAQALCFFAGANSLFHGERLLTTQGDANPVPDAEPVRGVQLRGEVWYSLPWVGHLNVLLTPGQHERLVQLAALLLFLYAGGVLWRGWRSRPRGTRALPGRPVRPRPTPVPSPADGEAGDREREAAA
ncbi:MAG: hypothetical protein ACPF9W_08115, partial [Nocardioides sp.]